MRVYWYDCKIALLRQDRIFGRKSRSVWKVCIYHFLELWCRQMNRFVHLEYAYQTNSVIPEGRQMRAHLWRVVLLLLVVWMCMKVCRKTFKYNVTINSTLFKQFPSNTKCINTVVFWCRVIESLTCYASCGFIHLFYMCLFTSWKTFKINSRKWRSCM